VLSVWAPLRVSRSDSVNLESCIFSRPCRGNSLSGRSVEPAGVQKDENDATSWNVTRSEGIIESTDRRCNQNRIHLGNVG
jgi:hypothetical protein